MFFNNKWHDQEKTNIKLKQQINVIDNSLENSFSRLKNDISHINQWINYLHTNQDRFTNTMQKFDAKIDNFLTKSELKHFVDQYYQDLDNIDKTMKTSIESSKNEIKGYVNTVYTNQKDIFQRLQLLSQQVYSQSSSKADMVADLQVTKQELRNMKSELRSTMQHEIEQQVSTITRREIDEKLESIGSQNTFEKLQKFNEKLEKMNLEISNLQQKTDTKQNLKERIFKKVTRHSKDYIKSMLLSYIKKYGKISGLQLREIVVEEQGLVSKSSFYRILVEIEEDESINVVHEGKEKHYFFVTQQMPNIK